MKDKDKKLLSFKESWQTNLRAIKLFWHISPKGMLYRTLDTVWSALTPYAGIWLSALIIEELAGSRSPQRLRILILAALICAAFFSLISALLNKVRQVEGTIQFFQMDYLLSAKMLELDYHISDDPETRKLLSTIRQNMRGGGWGIQRVPDNFCSILEAVFSLLGGLALTISLFISKVPKEAGSLAILNSPLLILLFLAGILTATALSSFLSTKADSYRALSSDIHNLSNRLFGYFGFLGQNKKLAADIRIYRQDQICKKYNNNKTDTFHSKGYFARLAKGPMGLYPAAATAVSILFLTGMVYLFVCLKAWAGAFGIGMVTQYIGAISRFSGSIGTLFGTAGSMRNNASFLKLIFDYLDIPNTMYQGSLSVEKRNDRKYEVEFRDVSFRYPGSSDYALRHINMKFKVGERLAVVGMNGSGKTTFIKLLCRLYDPTEGSILLNGIDIRKYDYQEYISVFSVVFQDFSLTDFTLGQNVASADTYEARRAELCLEKAGFGERLKELSSGLETYLGKSFSKEGVDMSGGEQQKIALARTLYKDAPFIVLDEPTAALDPIAEAEIYSKFNEIVEDKTAIYISHRLSSCRFCDNILVFHKGSMVQQGSHDRLVADETGKYYELWHAQAQYYNEQAQKAGQPA